MCVSVDDPEPVDSVLTFLSGYDTPKYSWVKATAVSVRLRNLFVTLRSTNKLSDAVAGNGSYIIFRLSRPCIFSFSLILPQPTLSMEHLSIQQLSSPKIEFYEPAPPADPILSTSYELSSGFIGLVQENSFLGRDCENPYHLREFEQVCSCLKISGMTHETLQWKLFSFSLSEEAKQWYIHVVDCVNGSWIELRNRFCSVFFPLSRICALRMEILTFR